MKIEKLRPAFKDYIWGGTKLRDVYGKSCGLERIAESWELSTHQAGQSVIEGGENDGMKLGDYIEKYAAVVLGENGKKFERFPVLIKFIDAKAPLSVQVHPSDEYALKNEGEYGKTEMWYIVECDEGASLYFGVKRAASEEEFRRRLADGSVEELLNKVPVHRGDVFFISSGTVHAIGEGIVICEIQQNSNLTYRVYDYGRVGPDGNQRELHIDKAMKVMDFAPPEEQPGAGQEEKISGGMKRDLASCKYFTTQSYRAETSVEFSVDEKSFASVIVTEGEGRISGAENTMEFKAGESLFIPAGSGKITVEGKCAFIKTTV